MQEQPLPLETRIAIERGAEALSAMRKAMESVVRELEYFDEQYAKVSNPAERARILNRAIGHVCANVLPNARIEWAADAQAELQEIAAKEAQA